MMHFPLLDDARDNSSRRGGAGVEPQAKAGIVSAAGEMAAAMSHWRSATIRADVMRGTGDDEAAYAAGWTVSGLATLATILAVWIFAI